MLRFVLLIPCIACTAVDAPEDVAEAMVFGFVNFERPGHVEAIVDPVDAWAASPDAAPGAGFSVDDLTGDDLEAVGLMPREGLTILGALGSAQYRADTVQIADGISSPKKAEIYEGTLRFDILDHDGDRACFLAGDCDAYTFVAEEEAAIPVLGTSVRTVTTELTWHEDEDGVRFLAMRQLVPEPTVFSSPVMDVLQQYGLTMFRPKPEGGTARIEALWVDAFVLGSSVPEGLAVSLSAGRMQKSADDLDLFFLGPVD